MEVRAMVDMILYQSKGIDYYWVPGDILLFHIPYPFDFILYFLAAVGLIVVLKWVYWLVWWLLDWLF